MTSFGMNNIMNNIMFGMSFIGEGYSCYNLYAICRGRVENTNTPHSLEMLSFVLNCGERIVAHRHIVTYNFVIV